MLASQRVLVMDPTLASVRDVLRLVALPKGPTQQGRGVLVLNRETLPGGLNARQLAEGLGTKPDVVIPDLPKAVGTATSMGEAAMTSRGGFRNGMMALAREVAFVRLPDGAAPASTGAAGSGGLLRRIFGRRS